MSKQALLRALCEVRHCRGGAPQRVAQEHWFQRERRGGEERRARGARDESGM
jgi:hypothetical protein